MTKQRQKRTQLMYRIRAVKHHKTIVMLIFFPDFGREANPEVGRHVRRVNERVKTIEINLITEILQHGQMDVDVVEIERHQGSRLGVLHHADGAARIKHQYGNLFVALHDKRFFAAAKVRLFLACTTKCVIFAA